MANVFILTFVAALCSSSLAMPHSEAVTKLKGLLSEKTIAAVDVKKLETALTDYVNHYDGDKNADIDDSEFENMRKPIEKFEEHDKDNSGNIDNSELSALLASLGQTKIDVKQAIAVMDINGDGHIDLVEFLEWVTLKPMTHVDAVTKIRDFLKDTKVPDTDKVVQALFHHVKHFDDDDNSLIDAEEYTRILYPIALFEKFDDSPKDGQINDAEFDKLMQALGKTDVTHSDVDKDNSGHVDLVEFLEWYRPNVAPKAA